MYVCILMYSLFFDVDGDNAKITYLGNKRKLQLNKKEILNLNHDYGRSEKSGQNIIIKKCIKYKLGKFGNCFQFRLLRPYFSMNPF